MPKRSELDALRAEVDRLRLLVPGVAVPASSYQVTTCMWQCPCGVVSSGQGHICATLGGFR